MPSRIVVFGATGYTGRLTADRQRLTQAMVQLAQNAVQHTEPGDRIALILVRGIGRAFLEAEVDARRLAAFLDRAG